MSRLKALRTPPADEKSGGFGLPGFLTGMRRDACETNYDCERPMVCCDLLVARVCCSSGLGIGSSPSPSIRTRLGRTLTRAEPRRGGTSHGSEIIGCSACVVDLCECGVQL